MPLAVLATTLLHGCASTPNLSPGNPLPGIGLEASGPNVVLSFAPASPLARQLRPNATLQLIASYQSEAGAVSGEPVSSGRVDTVNNAVLFKLPAQLNNTAASDVCLRIVHNRRPVPVRIARLGESSDGFHYREWAAQANQQRELLTLEADAKRIEQNVANFRAGDPNFAQWRDRQAVQSRADCARLATSGLSARRPATALDAASRPEAAGQQCVALFVRLLTERHWSNVPTLVELRPGLTGAKLAREVRSKIPERHRLSSAADRFVADVAANGRGRDHFEVAMLPINDGAKRSLWVQNDGVPSTADAVSLVEAYSGCLTETTGRFEQAYAAWQASRDPQLRQRLDQAKQAECRARFDAHQEIAERLAHWQSQQADNAEQIRRLKTAAVAPLPRRKALIPEPCAF